MLNTGEVETGIKLELVVVWFHVCTEFIKGLIMLFLFEMGQFMNNDHTQKGFRGVFEHRCDTDLIFAFEFRPLNT